MFLSRTLVVALICLSANVQAEQAIEVGPSALVIDQAQALLDAGQADKAVAALVPLPIRGRGTCVLGAALMATSEPARAILYLQRCHDFTPDVETRQWIAEARRILRKGSRAPVSLSITPESATAKISGDYSLDLLLANDDLWLKPGDYKIEASAKGHTTSSFLVKVESNDRMVVPLSLNEVKAPTTVDVDIGEDAGSALGTVSTTADPRPKKFKPIMPDRYRRAPDPELDGKGRGDDNPWPLVLGSMGAIGVGVGVGLHLNEQTTGALIAYGTGAALAGTALYMLLSSSDEDEAVVTTSISRHSPMVGLRLRW